MVAAWPGQGGHQLSALNAAEEAPDLGAITTLCASTIHCRLSELGNWVFDLAGKIWALAACWITLASNGDCLHAASQEGRGKVRQYKTHSHRFTSHDN